MLGGVFLYRTLPAYANLSVSILIDQVTGGQLIFRWYHECRSAAAVGVRKLNNQEYKVQIHKNSSETFQGATFHRFPYFVG